MMNNEFVLLQAERWAESSAAQSDRLGWLYETAFAREALPQERALAEETQRLQVPWESSSLTAEFCFRAGSEGRCK